MNNWNSELGDIEWVDQVYQLLLEIARSSLSDIPKNPGKHHCKGYPSDPEDTKHSTKT